jgi:AraC family L-rhamnose operon regulatory protein RhaS
MRDANLLDHYTGKWLVLPELVHFGWDRHRRSIARLKPHAHDRAWEVCYLVRGSVEWWCGREVHQVNRGDLYLTRPGEQHGGVDSMMHPCELYFFQIRFPTRGAMPGLTAAQTRAMVRAFDAIRTRRFAASPGILDAFRTIHAAHRRRTTLGVVTARAALHHILVTVPADHDRAVAARSSMHSQRIDAAMTWMDEHSDWPIEQVAAAVNLGVSRFHQLFVQETGFTPHDYRIRRKVAQARHLLRTTDRSVTDIAFALDFSSSQYFATVFKKLTGLTPQTYRRQVAQAA